MLYDLNIPWTSSTTPDQIDRILSFSASLGYNVVALNQTLSGPVPPRPQNPIPVVDPKRASASASSPAISSVLRRATFIYADPSSNYRLSAVAPLYDVFAVRPTTSAAFQHACISLTEAALISLDYSQQLPFRLHSRLVMAAVSRGVRFEVCYGAVLAGGGGGAGTADPRGRANFIANVSNLARASRGRGIVASSGATGPLGLRAPADVINLLAVWGLSPERGGEALGTLPRQVVANEAIKRRGFRAVIEVVETAERESVPARGREREEGGGGARDEAGAGVETKGPNQEKKKQGQKRKMGEQDNNDGGDGDGGTAAAAAAGMSKRQQKRLKKAQRQADPIIERRPDG